MKNIKRLLKLSLVCLLSLAVSCARVPIKNAEVCGDLASEGAECVNTLNDDTRSLTKDEWDQERFGMVCTKADNFAHWMASIIKLCKAAGNRCTYDSKKKIVKFMGKINDHIERTHLIHAEIPGLIAPPESILVPSAKKFSNDTTTEKYLQ